MTLYALLVDLRHFVATALLAFVALLPIVDPLGGAPIFIAMTAGIAADARVRMARAVALNSFLLLLASALTGAYVLAFFGLSVPAVQVAGGIVICSIAWSLLSSATMPGALAREGQPPPSPDALSQRAFYPLTMPLTVGPGAIAVSLTLGASPTSGLLPLVTTALAHVLGIAVVATAVYLCYRFADRIVRRLGPTGTAVVVRLSAFILLCIGVQICWNGIHAFITGAAQVRNFVG
ncbi:MAG: MarC family protein [Gemmatimonadota bacterium]